MVKVAQAAGIGACVWLLVALFFGEMGLPRYLAMRDHAVQLDEELSALREETALLRKDIGRLERIDKILTAFNTGTNLQNGILDNDVTCRFGRNIKRLKDRNT